MTASEVGWVIVGQMSHTTFFPYEHLLREVYCDRAPTVHKGSADLGITKKNHCRRGKRKTGALSIFRVLYFRKESQPSRFYPRGQTGNRLVKR